ncbi:hypothetical protein RJ55_00640 [Drechmeria coniospora]|nr:hypothetical protein RJ55_00640 [Drechmeria coniospora]
MSGEGPESIPTSADPRSRRATKKRALTPVSAQAATVAALFANPDRPVRMPAGVGDNKLGRARAAIPETVAHVQGSSAGAGSGEFHVYKASRRREYERLRVMDQELRQERHQADFEKDRDEKARKDDAKTRKNRERREKMKARKANRGKGVGNSPLTAATLAAGVERNGTPRPSEHGSAEGGDDPVAEADACEARPNAAQPTGLVIHDDDD